MNNKINTHTLTHTYIKTLCPVKRYDVTLTLEKNQKTPTLLEGKPIACSCQNFCHETHSARCYLKMLYVTAQPKRTCKKIKKPKKPKVTTN